MYIKIIIPVICTIIKNGNSFNVRPYGINWTYYATFIYDKEYYARVKNDHNILNEENNRFLTGTFNIIMLCRIAYTTLEKKRPLVHTLN